METFYVVIVALLFILAISDLIVGVSNDAVNFLVSAIGSKAAPFWAIMIIASLGIVVGATFSSGMMEVARKGIFHPNLFMFSEIMIIFLAVMLTDIILLDLFNTFGFPTSTTVSIVFELLGAAVSISIIKIAAHPEDSIENLGKYINSEQALLIIGGILLSVVVAFTVGAIVQYIARVMFSFNVDKTYSYFGAIWAGLAITAITYFILIKGAKGASFMSGDVKEMILQNRGKILLISFVGWTIVLQLISWLTKFNVLKFVVLVGTFALAMAFAGNDLVNFIGVPLAGLKSFTEFNAVGGDPHAFSMESLSEKVQTPTTYLLIAGLIMVITLWFSKKARSVTATSINLSRQDEGYERFESSPLARVLVRGFLNFTAFIKQITPAPVAMAVGQRFEPLKKEVQRRIPKNKGDAPAAFDLIRASVNLVVASILISFATSLKLPLSTTYVTFMVAMGSSLADGAWGRESAVYRITGVISVITGWFITALVAFTVSFVFALLIHLGGGIAIAGLAILAVFLIVRTQRVHKKRMVEEAEVKEKEHDDYWLEEANILELTTTSIKQVNEMTQTVFDSIIDGLAHEDRRILRDAKHEAEIFHNHTKELKLEIPQIIRKLKAESVENAHFYVQIVDYLREVSNCLRFIVVPCFEHINNNHKGFTEAQINELKGFYKKINTFFIEVQKLIETKQYKDIGHLIELQQDILENISVLRRTHLKRIKYEQASTKRGLLYLNILAEAKNLMLFVVHLLKAQRDFVVLSENTLEQYHGDEEKE